MGVAESLNPEDSFWHCIAVNLRRERQRRNLTLQAVADIINAASEGVGTADRQGIGNYEANRLHITEEHARALDQAWGTTFIAWRKFAVLLGSDEDWWKQLFDFEKGALVVKVCIPDLVPVPLQTEGYARELIRQFQLVYDIDDAVRRRMSRTKDLRDQLPKMSLWTLIDESALDPPMPVEVKREQLNALLELSPGASMRIVPSSARLHAGVGGGFQLITTAKGVEVAYVWAQLEGRLVHDPSEVRELALRYDRIGARALSEEGSRELVAKKLELLQ
ncbi:hypothetical protein J4573_46840 [Actinomadura barringtoniae]|uniref:DUF5753 domain-containing protein n=1 Tax=Actinomadura barringtoniae TaxID=1427535 RepID=A0A939PKX2_9ACTN|nr:DUF5753 domain-containing protein [Actinomadura barringtoniae]MBO2454676.1 hypothetical protein [Actinomadura barringtoniae]